MSESVTEENTSAFIEAQGAKIHYHDVGKGHPIVFLHGSGPGATAWSNFGQNIEVLSKQFRVIAIDFPGWGQSDLEIPGEGKLTDAVELVLDELGIKKAAFVGNSLGGATSIAFAAQHSGRVSHLITMGSPAPGVSVYSGAGLESEGLKVLFATFREPTPENFKRLVEIMCFDSKFATEELAKERSEAALRRPEFLEAFLSGRLMQVMPNLRETTAALMELQVPTLAIHGRNDKTVHFENSMRLVSLIPDSRLVLLNRCGHWAQLEHAAEFNDLVAGFVAGTR
jgi:2-hydroxy-6-oxonona-2,4-dienedioate hydrolase